MENKKRLIFADEALEKVCENCCEDYEECKRKGFCMDYMNIDQLSTVDAVEVVRCKDCASSWSQPYTDLLVCCALGCRGMKPDDFCSYGKRRANG